MNEAPAEKAKFELRECYDRLAVGEAATASRSPRAVTPLIAGLLGLGYIVVPNSHHVLLAGVPLSIVGAGGLVLAVACAIFRSSRAGVALIGFLLVLLAIKSAVAVGIPAPGFSADYFANARFEGEAYRRIDRRIVFEARTFPRDFLNGLEFFESSRLPGDLPFSVVWHGTVLVDRTMPLALDVVASEPASVTVDGRELRTTPLAAGAHEVVVRFIRQTQTPPSIRVAMTPEVPIFTAGVSPVRARFAEGYARASIVLDLLLLIALAWVVLRGTLVSLAAPRTSRWMPPLCVSALVTVAFWFTVGAVRLGPRWLDVDLVERGEDYSYYEAVAQRIMAGHFGGDVDYVKPGSFTYPYALAILHMLFGSNLAPVYFAQHLIVALSCVARAELGRRLWGEKVGLAVLVTAVILSLADVNRWYVVRTLSENLELLLLPATFLAVYAYLRNPGLARGVLTGAMLAMTALTRFTLLPFSGLVLLYLLWRHARVRDDRATVREWPAPLALVVGFAVVFASFPLHEYLLTGDFAVLPHNTFRFWKHRQYVESTTPSWEIAGALIKRLVVPNIAFMLGYPKLLVRDFALRPHWVILWATFLLWCWKRRESSPPPMNAIFCAYIALYVAVMITNTAIQSYGYRYMLGLFSVLGMFLPLGAGVIFGAVYRGVRRARTSFAREQG